MESGIEKENNPTLPQFMNRSGKWMIQSLLVTCRVSAGGIIKVKCYFE